MQNFLPKISLNCIIAAALCLAALALLPLKLVLILAVAYWVARTAGVFKFKFPDVWKNEEESGDITKEHKVFVAKPVRVDGMWHIFTYLNRVVVGGKSHYFSESEDVANDTPS